MPFEVFDKRQARLTDEPMVTIQRRGFIAMNHAAFNALGSPKAVELLYDRAKHIVGLRSANLRAPHVYPVRPNTKGTSHVVSGLAFVKHYGIDASVARRWRAEMRGDILCVETGRAPVYEGSITA
jgi:hypothetical protein